METPVTSAVKGRVEGVARVACWLLLLPSKRFSLTHSSGLAHEIVHPQRSPPRPLPQAIKAISHKCASLVWIIYSVGTIFVSDSKLW